LCATYPCTVAHLQRRDTSIRVVAAKESARERAREGEKARERGRERERRGGREGERERKRNRALFPLRSNRQGEPFQPPPAIQYLNKYFVGYNLMYYQNILNHEDTLRDLAPVSPINYRCTSLIRTPPPLRPHSRTMPRALWWS
jgi:hypothetical protein